MENAIYTISGSAAVGGPDNAVISFCTDANTEVEILDFTMGLNGTSWSYVEFIRGRGITAYPASSNVTPVAISKGASGSRVLLPQLGGTGALTFAVSETLWWEWQGTWTASSLSYRLKPVVPFYIGPSSAFMIQFGASGGVSTTLLYSESRVA